MAQMFKINNTEYTTNEAGTYFYKTGTNGKKWRIAKCEYEQAFEEYVNQKTDEAEAQEFENEMQEAKEQAAKKQAENDKAAEDAMNKSANRTETKTARKPRRSKDVAYEMVKLNGEISETVVTLTAKQVDFLKGLQGISFWDDGINSALWCDCIAQDTGWNPMSVGAMISTLREKDLVAIGQDRVNGRKCKYMVFTDLGKEVAKDLGLH